MKRLIILLATFSLAVTLQAQTPVADAAGNYTDEQLDVLVAPIALYPDPLVALVLPAAASPGDIALAARYLDANGDPDQVESQPWDDSVKALMHYPDVIRWMNENLDWATALGHAFARQPVQVMQSIQQMRAEARASGALQNTPQQTVSMVGSTICIVPAQPEVIYVPQYDPAIIFVESPVYYPAPIIVFGPPCLVGPWLRFRCDWDDYAVWVGTWHPGWTYVREWRQPRGVVVSGGFWHPDPIRQRAVLRPPRLTQVVPRPRPMPGAPAVAPRPAPGVRPPPSGVARPDPRGWRTDANGRPAGTSPSPNPSRGQGSASVPPAINRSPPPMRPGPPPRPAASAPGPAPRPASPPPGPAPMPVTPAPVPHTPLPHALPVNPLTPSIGVPQSPGPAFGTYERGTATHDFSERGQASRAAVAPEPVHAAPASMPRAAPAAPPPRAAPAASPSSSAPNDADPNGRNRR